MRSLTLAALFTGASAFLISSAFAAGFFHSVKDPATKKECGACHMVYPPALLPARSWEKIVGDLSNHFGEDASLPDPVRANILAYLTQNAGDSGQTNSWFMRGVRDNVVPPRITEMPFWRGIHGGFSPASFKRPGVKKRGNCLGCHS